MAAATEVEITLPRPFADQADVLIHPARFKVPCFGRQGGKSTLTKVACVEGHGETPGQYPGVLQGADIGWIGLSFTNTVDAWRDFEYMLRPVARNINKTERRIDVYGGGSLRLFSVEALLGGRGPTLDGLAFDEAAFMPGEIWEAVFRPTLSIRRGWAIFPTTPNGFNWLHGLWSKGGVDPEWASWQIPVTRNPFISPEELESIRHSCSEVRWRQEYLAEFTAQEGRVFGDFSRSRHVKPCPIQEHLPLAIGVDFGYRTFGMVAAQVDKLDTLRIFADGEWKGLTTEQAIDRLKRLPWASRIEMIAVDPAGDSVNLHSGITDVKLFKAAFPNARVTFSYDPKHRDPEWRASRLRDRMWSAAGDCRLIVDPSCTATIRSLESSVYPPHKDGQQERKQPLKDGVTDHIRDALGYLEVNRFHRAKAQWVAR